MVGSTSSGFGGGSTPFPGSTPIENNLIAGTFQLNGVTITLTSGENLTNIASSINAVSSQSNVTASIVKLSSTDTRIVLTGKNTGSANAISITNDNTNFSSTNNLTVTQAAQDAQIQFNGNTVTRSTNTINDLVPDVTFNLYQPTASGVTANLSIDKDDTTIATAIGSFVDAYNALRTFQAQQTQTDPTTGALVSGAVLGDDPTMSTIINALSSAIGNQTSEAIPDDDNNTAVPTRLGDLGISLDVTAAGTSTTNADGSVTPGTPEVDNILTVDTSQLATELDTNFDAVANIFQFGFTSSSSDLTDYSRDNTVATSNLTITNNSGVYSISAIDGSALTTPVQLTATTASNGQVTLTDPNSTDSVLAALSFTYTDNGSGSMNQQITNSAKDFALTVDPTQPTGSQASVTSILGQTLATPISLTYTASGSSAIIQGATGGSFAGLQMLYTGSQTSAENINVSIQQGIADSVYNSLTSMISGTGNNDGLLTTASTNLTSTDTQLQTQITAINTQVAAYRNQLQTKFANLESAIGSANSLLELLSAQSNAALEETSGS